MIISSALIAELHVLKLHSWNMNREGAVMVACIPQSVFLIREKVSLISFLTYILESTLSLSHALNDTLKYCPSFLRSSLKQNILL